MALPDIWQKLPIDTIPSVEESKRTPGFRFGIYLPRRTLTTEDLTQEGLLRSQHGLLDAQGLLKRTGIPKVHVASSDETPEAMAFASSLGVLQETGKTIDKVVATLSFPDGIHQANNLARRYGLPISQDDTIDIIAACSGGALTFIHMLTHENEFKGKRVLVSHTEKYQDKVCHVSDGEEDASTSEAIFSDGSYTWSGIYGVDFQPIGCRIYNNFSQTENNALGMPIDWNKIPKDGNCHTIPIPHPGNIPGAPYSNRFYMNGREVFRIMIDTLPDATMETLRDSGVGESEVGHIFYHQASIKMLQGTQRRLPKSLQDKVRFDLSEGNLSSGSIMKAVGKAMQRGEIRPGQTLLFGGFGAGLNAAFVTVRIGNLPLAA